MLISNNISNYNIYNSALPRKVYNVGLRSDTVSFSSSKPYSIENEMKKISGLHDPYSEIVMVSDLEYQKYMQKVKKRPTAQSVLNLLKDYDDNLFSPEKSVCDKLQAKLDEVKAVDSKLAKSLDLKDLMNLCYDEAKDSLLHNQVSVLENINEIIATTRGVTNEKLTEIFDSVEKNIVDDSFRISPLLNDVRSLKGIDKGVKKYILCEMDNLPNSRNSADVFIVTNAHKSHKEIAEAFITPSRVSIEHIRPQSCGGESNLGNYLIASKRMNSLRSSIPLNLFIKRNPQIPNYIDVYFKDLVAKINKGGLTYMAISLPDVKKAIEKESRGCINVELDEISSTERSKIADFTAQLNDLIRKFCK